MFKTLFGTFLLCSSLGAYKPKENAVLPINQLSYRCNGDYTFNDYFNWDYLFDNYSDDLRNGLTFYYDRTVDSGNASVYAVNGNSYIGYQGSYSLLSELQIDINYDSTFYFYMYLVSSHYTIEIEEDDYQSISYVDDLLNATITTHVADVTNVIQNFVLSFGSDFFANGEECLIFNTLFSSQGNRYVTAYNGWYYFNNIMSYNNVFELGGNYIVDNKYYDYLSYGEDTQDFEIMFGIYKTYPNTDITYFDQYIIFKEDKLLFNGNIQFSALIPQDVYGFLNNSGVFQFRQTAPDTTFYEMILSIMDAPLYYLTSLFNFQLFGMDMFIAFSSILTLLVVIVVIRKVI